MTSGELSFLQKIVSAALRIEATLKIPHNVTIGTLGQAMEETANGKSSLIAEGNNPFGMRWYYKFHSTDPLSPVRRQSFEYVRTGTHIRKIPTTESFRHFPDLDHALISHFALLQGRRYLPAMKAAESGWKEFLLQLGPLECGYATDPEYGNHVIERVQEFKLYDDAALKAYSEGRNPLAVN